MLLTIFHEPINIRAENVERIRAQGEKLGAEVKTDVFASPRAWRAYAVEQLKLVERICIELGIYDRLHLWPDKSLGSRAALNEMPDPVSYSLWLYQWWSRISEWPTQV